MSKLLAMMMNNKKLNPIFNIVGNPTITKNFIYKDVGINDYIYINEILPLSTANTWKIQTKFIYKRNTNNPYASSPIIAYYGDNSNDGKSPVLRIEGAGDNELDRLRVLISSVGNSNWNINVATSNYYFIVDNEYYIEYGFDGYMYYVKDLYTNTNIWTKNNSSKCECSNYIALFHNGFVIGGDYELCGGEMDMKKFKVFINDELYLKGVI